MRNMTADEIAEYVGVKLEETTEDDVFPFNEELVADEFPVLVKFHESWCARCQHMKSAFEYAASKTVGRVMFMEVECSSTVDTRKFCGKHRIDGFPTLMLMVCAARAQTLAPRRPRAPSFPAPQLPALAIGQARTHPRPDARTCMRPRGRRA
jgi:thiol-disulfide isomerase/thioredoxin